ncbi:MAG: hypothetical protein U1G05_19515 [Kiritimatiellia bacterium]
MALPVVHPAGPGTPRNPAGLVLADPPVSGRAVAVCLDHGLGDASGAAGRRPDSRPAKVQSAVITLVCAMFVTGSVAEEKEAGGIDLLLMTGMSPVSLLAGLTGSHVLTIALTLASMFPFMLLGATLGAPIPARYLPSWPSSAAMRCSGRARSLARAGDRTRMMALAAFVLYAAGGRMLLAAFGVNGAMATRVLDDLFARPDGYDFPLVWCLTDGIAGLAFFIIACLRFRACVPGGGWLSALSILAPAAGRRPRPLGGGQIAWKDWQFNYGGRRGVNARLCVIALLAGLAAVGADLRGAAMEDIVRVNASALLFMSYTGFTLESLFHSARMYRMDDSVELQDDLRSMPLSVERIMAQKESAFLRAMSAAYLPGTLAGLLIFSFLDTTLALGLAITLSLLAQLLWTLHLMIAERSLTRGWMAIPLALGKIAGQVLIWTLVFSFVGGVTFGLGLVLIPVAYVFVVKSLFDAAHAGLAKKFLAAPHSLWSGEHYVRVRRKPAPHIRRISPPRQADGG